MIQRSLIRIKLTKFDESLQTRTVFKKSLSKVYGHLAAMGKRMIYIG